MSSGKSGRVRLPIHGINLLSLVDVGKKGPATAVT